MFDFENLDEDLAEVVDEKATEEFHRIAVVTRHALSGDSVKVSLSRDATFIDLRQALASHLGSDDILESGQFVSRRFGRLCPLSYKGKDTLIQCLCSDDVLGKPTSKIEVLMSGVDFGGCDGGCLTRTPSDSETSLRNDDSDEEEILVDEEDKKWHEWLAMSLEWQRNIVVAKQALKHAQVSLRHKKSLEERSRQAISDAIAAMTDARKQGHGFTEGIKVVALDDVPVHESVDAWMEWRAPIATVRAGDLITVGHLSQQVTFKAKALETPQIFPILPRGFVDAVSFQTVETQHRMQVLETEKCEATDAWRIAVYEMKRARKAYDQLLRDRPEAPPRTMLMT